MKKFGWAILLLVMLVAFSAKLALSESNDNYYIDGNTKVLWDERMLTQYPDVAYIHVGHDVDKFIVQVSSDTYGPLDMEVTSPSGTTVYDYYSTQCELHNMKKLITVKKYGAGVYTVKVFHGNTANIGYLLTIKGPNAIGLDEGDGGCSANP